MDVREWSDGAAVQVFRDLDPMDHLEAEIASGQTLHQMAAFAEWRAMNPMRVLSVVLVDQGVATQRPFAVLGVNATGQYGVGEAALLARRHTKFRRELTKASLEIRRQLPGWANRAGLNRIEARSWTGHPTAGVFLRSCGFKMETEMFGFGASGREVFRQYVWTKQDAEKEKVDDENNINGRLARSRR